MCDSCLPQQNRFRTVFCIYTHLTTKKGYGPEMWLKDFSPRSRELRDTKDGTVLAIFRRKQNYDSSYWSLRKPADNVTDEIPSGYGTEDVFIQDAMDVFNLMVSSIQ